MADFLGKAAQHQVSAFNRVDETQWNGPFTFIHAADTQFGLIESFTKGNDNLGWKEDMELARKAVSKINKMDPKPCFVVVGGDLVDAFPDTKPEMHEAQKKDFLDIFSKLDSGIPLICVSGNHDLGNSPTLETMERYKNSFGDDYFSFWCRGVLFIVLNSQYFQDSSHLPHFAKAQELWLEDVIASAKKQKPKYTIVFQHIPIFLKDPDEEDDYFNMNNEIRKPFLDKLHDAGVNAVFCGHYHRNGGGFYKSLEMVITSAVGLQLGEDVSGFRVVTVGEQSVTHDYVDLN